MSDALGDRMKMYEGVEAQRRFMPLTPVVARLDGRGFSRFTHGFRRPYDKRMSDLMIATTRHLVEESGALMGYTQSDEITLVWLQPHLQSEIFFAGRIQKMCSSLAAMATVYFNRHKNETFAVTLSMQSLIETLTDPPHVAGAMPTFDCRVWSVPTKEEAVNCFLWRENDATKNSISMAAQSMYSHKELQGKTGPEMQEMLWQKGKNWNDYPTFFKRGTYLQRRKTKRKFTLAELDALPPAHAARLNPDLEVERSDVVKVEMPPLAQVVNRVDVIFSGAKP